MLVILAALLLQSLVQLQDASLGFEPRGVMNTRVSLPAQKYPEPVTIAEFHRRLLDSLEPSPAIRSVAP